MKWYTTSKVDDVQGLINDEETGKTIAVCYDAKHAQLIAAAPKLFQALDRAIQDIDSGFENAEEIFPWLEDARAAIAEVESFS